ncbi:hypothetical protein D3C85_1273340 [compost metagenome]
MEISANHINVEQLVALIEARQFPIGVDFTDPLARRLYDACSVLMCHASVAGRQAAIARRHINTAMSDMGNNQGGYYHLKKCLEEMNAQEQGETATVVLCQQYQEELNEVIPAAIAIMTDLSAIADGMQRLAPGLMDALGQADEAPTFGQGLKDTTAILRTAVDLLKALMEFAGCGVLAVLPSAVPGGRPVGGEETQ